MYIYESHLGGLYTSDEYLDNDCLYCEDCGDSDFLIGNVHTKKEAYDLLKNWYDDEENCDYDRIQEIVDSIEECDEE